MKRSSVAVASAIALFCFWQPFLYQVAGRLEPYTGEVKQSIPLWPLLLAVVASVTVAALLADFILLAALCALVMLVLCSEALLQYQALEIGPFYLTCRDYYEVFQMKARHVRIDHFNPPDKERFVRTFLSAFKGRMSAADVLEDLEKRGFSEFLSHPLLLTLPVSSALARQRGIRGMRFGCWTTLSMFSVTDGTNRKAFLAFKESRWTGPTESKS